MQTREWAGPPVAIRTKVEPVSGFPEWLPNERLEEQRIIRTIQGVYELYGFVPIETPAVERLDVLTAKGGMQRQIFSLGRPQEDDSNQGLGLHFDLTVPLARYVVQHAPKLSFPFRRYQIQKVWRGERSQKGRFREFYQCDVDIIGRGALDLIHDAEIPCVINATFEALGIPDFEIHVSNRRIFGAVLAAFGIPERQDGGLNDRFISALRAIDKTHRDGVEQTREALAGIGLAAEAIQSVVDLIQCRDLPAAELLLSSIGADQAGLRELKSVMVGAKALGMPGERLVVDFRIARGLDYYTGTTYESYIKGKESWGSICSGGRFDDLASYFTSQKYPGVGISIGLTRLFELLLQSELLDVSRQTPALVLVTMQDRERYMEDYLGLAKTLRAEGIPTEVYLDPHPLREQIGYTAAKNIPLAVIAGGAEFSENLVRVRDLRLKSEEIVTDAEFVPHVRRKLGMD
jgi:histidyl-tRNA synthetase